MVIACLLIALAPIAAADEPVPASPRLRRLQEDVAQKRSEAIAAFWRERQSVGAPLIEPLRDGQQVLVTFLWRGDASTKNVFVISLDQVQFAHAAYLERGRMALLAGTDVWYRTYRMPCNLRFSYRFAVNHPGGELHPDTLNPRHYASRSGDSSVAELPCAEPQPEVIERPGIPRGDVTSETFSGPSGERHALQIYMPPRTTDAGKPLALLVLIGGGFSPEFPVPTILDNLIAEERIPPTMAVSIGFSDMAAYVKASRSDERFARYVAGELLPWLQARYPIADDPRRVVIAGASAPGAGALFIAMRHPELFGNVLTQSGGYAYPTPTGSDELMVSQHPEAEPLARELATSAPLPLRVFLAAGTLDDVTYEGKDPFYAQSTVLVAARHLRDVLEAKGYCLRYREFGGGHEALAWRGTFAEGLAWLLGYSPEKNEGLTPWGGGEVRRKTKV